MVPLLAQGKGTSAAYWDIRNNEDFSKPEIAVSSALQFADSQPLGAIDGSHNDPNRRS